jgi:hypothetical protein
MNPTQIFEFARNWINQKIIKFNWVPLGRNRARQQRCAGTRETARNGGSPVRGRWRGAMVTGEQRGSRGGTAAVQAARLGQDGGGMGEACGGGREAVGRAASARALSRRRWRVRCLTGGARSSAISELKITPNENSSKQIFRDWDKFWKNSWR